MNNIDNIKDLEKEINTEEKLETPESKDGYTNPAEKKVGVKKEDRLIGAVCYAPFGFFAPYVMKRSSNFLSIHVKQGAIIFMGFLFTTIILSNIGINLNLILFLIYVGLAGYASHKAFNGHAFQYKFLNKIISDISKFFNNSSK